LTGTKAPAIAPHCLLVTASGTDFRATPARPWATSVE
jgi:hypothetical protein